MEKIKYDLSRKVCAAFGWMFAVLALLSLIGLVVCIIMLGFGTQREALVAALTGGFASGTVLFGLAGYLFMLLAGRASSRYYDELERADGENSFFIGDGVLATFGEKVLVVHGEGKKELRVPYEEARFFSVCVRRAPREKGEWNVLFELPGHYFAKSKENADEHILVQAEGKERLYRCLEARGLVLLGEKREDGKKKFRKLKGFILPERDKRRQAFFGMIAGAAVLAVGGGLMFWNTVLGAVVAVAGGYLFFRMALAHARAKQSLSFYREGVFFKTPVPQDSLFLKWEEIERATASENAIRMECAYGAYEFPRPSGAYEFLRAQFPQKCGEQGKNDG